MWLGRVGLGGGVLAGPSLGFLYPLQEEATEAGEPTETEVRGRLPLVGRSR